MTENEKNTKELKEQIDEDFLQLTDEALDALQDMMTDENINPLARVQAIGLILDRGLGKARESIEVSTVAERVAQVRPELEALFETFQRDTEKEEKAYFKKVASRRQNDEE